MDDQTAEKMAKLAADNLRLKDEVKLLKRQRTMPSAAVLQAIQGDVDTMREVHDERLGELEALQKRYDQLREEWMAEHGAALVLRAKVEELQPVQHGDVVVDTRPVHVAALMAEVEMLRASQGSAARHLQDDLRALQLTYDDLEIRERRQGRELVNVQAAYANLLGGDFAKASAAFRIEVLKEVNTVIDDAIADVGDPYQDPGVLEDLRSRLSGLGGRTPSHGKVETRLDLLEAHCFPKPLDTPKDTDEG